MNSSTNNDFDAKLDGLLKESVSLGAEPAEFAVVVLPRRCRFNWALISGVAIFTLLAGTILLFWRVLAQPREGAAERAVPGQDLWVLLSDGITSGAQNLSSPDFLMPVATVMAVVYFFFASRIMRLYRLY